MSSSVFALAIWYFAASASAFIMYGLDKAAARKQRWRIRQSTLHLLGLVGGWPGALLAQWLWRHKTRKATFQALFWATAIINCVVFARLVWACA